MKKGGICLEKEYQLQICKDSFEKEEELDKKIKNPAQKEKQIIQVKNLQLLNSKENFFEQNI